jgi:hypothetical protein
MRAEWDHRSLDVFARQDRVAIENSDIQRASFVFERNDDIEVVDDSGDAVPAAKRLDRIVQLIGECTCDRGVLATDAWRGVEVFTGEPIRLFQRNQRWIAPTDQLGKGAHAIRWSAGSPRFESFADRYVEVRRGHYCQYVEAEVLVLGHHVDFGRPRRKRGRTQAGQRQREQ